jgi:surface carbohydrate biosynthesis protein
LLAAPGLASIAFIVKPPRVLITVDNKWRDLPGLVWLGVHLGDLGLEVRYARNTMEASALWRHRPDVVVLNHVMDGARRKLLAKMRETGLRVIVLPTEGIPGFGEIPDLDPDRYGSPDCVDLHLVWNGEYERHLKGLNRWPEDAIRRVGVPRFDFYRPPLRGFLPSREDFAREWNLDPARKNLVFTTNFTHARYHVRDQEVLREDYSKLGVGRRLKDTPEIARRDFESREIFTKALMRVPDRFPDVNVVVRPHPNEEHSYWDEVMGKLGAPRPGARAALVVRGGIWDVLANADVLVQRSCTTGMEAWMLDLPTIEQRINPDEWYISEGHAAGSDLATSESGLWERVEHYLRGGAIPSALRDHRRAWLDRWCGDLDGRSSSRAARAIANLANSSPRASYPTGWRRLRHSASFWVQTAGDHAVHDRMTGASGTFDKRGRLDKWIHFADVQKWRLRLAAAPRSASTDSPPPLVSSAGKR